MSPEQHTLVRGVLEWVEQIAAKARDDHKAGLGGMPIKADDRSVGATYEGQTVILE